MSSKAWSRAKAHAARRLNTQGAPPSKRQEAPSSPSEETADVLELEELGGYAVPQTLEERRIDHLNRHIDRVEKFREIYQRSMKRICSNCGHVDRSERPPITCPNCHFEEKSVLAPKVSKMNRAERRRQEAMLRLRNRAIDKQIAKLPKPIAG